MDYCAWKQILFVLILCPCSMFGFTPIVYLDNLCGLVIPLDQSTGWSLQLQLTHRVMYKPFTDCHVTILSPIGMKIGVNFFSMDINSYQHCIGDYLQVYDGVEITNSTFKITGLHEYKTFCGKETPKPLTSKHENLTFRFVSDSTHNGQGFTLLINAFHFGSCGRDEYRCNNERCIHTDLTCVSQDFCGDGTNSCRTTQMVIVGGAVSACIFTIAMLFICAVLHYRFGKKSDQFQSDFDTLSLGPEYGAATENQQTNIRGGSGLDNIAYISSFQDMSCPQVIAPGVLPPPYTPVDNNSPPRAVYSSINPILSSLSMESPQISLPPPPYSDSPTTSSGASSTMCSTETEADSHSVHPVDEKQS